MLYWLIPLIIGVVLFVAFITFRVKQKRVTAVIIKGFVSLMFIVTALVAWLTSKNPQSTFGIFVLIGLFFGLLGDVLLDLKFIVLEKEPLLTKLGFIAFALGHIFYVVGLFTNFFNFGLSVLYIIIPIIITLVFVAMTLLMEKFTPIRYKGMKPYVIMYGFVLFFTVTIFMSAAIQTRWEVTTVWMFAVSLFSFALSDLILNNTYFASGFDGPGFIISNHVFYYAAQFAIAVSLFFLI